MLKKNCYLIIELKYNIAQIRFFWIASLINPCWPTNISLKKLIIPIQITGLTSTPPIGGITFLVILRIELVGNEISNQNPLFNFTLGYQVNINLIRKTKVRNERKIPNVKSKMDK